MQPVQFNELNLLLLQKNRLRAIYPLNILQPEKTIYERVRGIFTSCILKGGPLAKQKHNITSIQSGHDNKLWHRKCEYR